MANAIRLRTLDQFEAVVNSNAGLVITDSARRPVFHPSPQNCLHVQQSYFATKVLENEERNGSYFAAPSLTAAQRKWREVKLCRSGACSEAVGLSGAPSRLEWALREGTGLAEVRARRREPSGAEVMPPGWESSQRLALGHSGNRLVLRTWPGELKAQAHALYVGNRSARLLDLIGTSEEWSADPLPHLAYNGSRPQDRFYFSCPLPIDRYLSFWSEPENLARVGGHPLRAIEPNLWPWLCEHEVGDPGDPDNAVRLHNFVERLNQRRTEGLLRPSVELTRAWDLSLENDPDALVREVRAAVEQVAAALREQPPQP